MVKQKSGDWLSVVEAAKRLGVARATIYQAIAAGKLRARLKTVTRKVWRVDPASLAGFEVSAVLQRAGKRSARARLRKA
ncbi:MAG: helix-turn-helix domain-containing protein [Candidatus Binataceae bacterium]